MAGGWTADGAVQEQITHSIEDEISRVRSLLPTGESLLECEECGEAIPPARREALPGVRLCISCQEEHDQERAAESAYNRSANKDSQLK